MAEWHAHLNLCGLAGLVALLFGQHVDAVMVFAAEPQLALARHPHGGGRQRFIAVLVAGLGDQFHLARLGNARLAQQQATAVGLAGADRAQVLGLGLVVVAVEAAHHALATGGGDARYGLHFHRHVGLRLAVQRQRQRLELHLAGCRHPAFGLHARDHRRRPQRLRAAQRLHFAVRVGISGFEHHVLRRARLRHLVEGDRARALGVQRQRQLVGNHAAVVRRG
ncbi:hypothetical protein SDC9_105378 [bioreactor metagenome]|uniref:Uncharacterized protein n=1 Tax=bioreactor metagenome TaxID=1076179 RepID=A0A645AZF3_9ZZZZ